MRKITIFSLVLALCLGFALSAQANELSVLTIINNMLTAQGYNAITQTDLDNSLVSYEIFGPGTYTITYYGKQAGNNQHAYAYAVGDSSNYLFDLGSYVNNSNGTEAQGKLSPAITFSPTVNWGLKDTAGSYTFYSESSLNTADNGKAHWHLYCLQGLNTGIDIGFAVYEDLPNYDYDYNDLVLKIEPNPSPAPIPASLLLLGSGILGMVCIGMRKRS